MYGLRGRRNVQFRSPLFFSVSPANVQPSFNCRSTVVQPDLQSGCFLKYRQIANLPERINLPERAILLERINLPEQSQNNVIYTQQYFKS